jgi:probable phosphoglycerate mutase
MRLILVRHGQSPSNGVLDTAVPGPGLTEVGAMQATALPQSLADEQIDAIYASSQARAQLTAAPLAEALRLRVHVRDGLREIAAGDLEMRGDAASVERYLTTVFAWSAGDLGLRMPGGEDGTEVLERLDRVVAGVSSSGSRTAVLVGHGAAIRMWTATRTDNVDATFATAHGLTNTGIVVLEGDPATGWHALSWTGATIGGSSLGT